MDDIKVEMTTRSTADDDTPAPPPQDDLETGGEERKDAIATAGEAAVDGDDDSDTDEDEDVHTSLRTTSRRDELLKDADDNANLISRLFPRDPKAIGTRRYLMVLFASLVLVALFTFLFVQYYIVSVVPIQQLTNTDMYQNRVCVVKDQNLVHDVTVGLGSTWRGELRVEYNLTQGVSSEFGATVHELVTGQLGFQSTAVAFLRRADHQVGAKFNCLVDIANMPFYAVPVSPPQQVAGSVITSMTFIMIFDLVFAFLMLRSLYNFYLFLRFYSWNADLNVWVVEGHGGSKRQEMLPP